MLNVRGRSTTIPKDAWFVAILLLLQRRENHIISDVDGLVLRKLAHGCGLPTPVVPQQLSAAVRELREFEIVTAQAESNRTYSVELNGRLSDRCVRGLEKFADWAHQVIKGQSCVKPSGGLPEIEFCEDES